MARFLPTGRQAILLLAVGVLSLGYAFYLRFRVIEAPAVALACDTGLQDFVCVARRLAISLFRESVFGWMAIGAAVLNLIRPSVALFALTLAAAGLGLVLYNVDLAALAVALLILSLGRPASAAGSSQAR